MRVRPPLLLSFQWSPGQIATVCEYAEMHASTIAERPPPSGRYPELPPIRVLTDFGRKPSAGDRQIVRAGTIRSLPRRARPGAECAQEFRSGSFMRPSNGLTTVKVWRRCLAGLILAASRLLCLGCFCHLSHADPDRCRRARAPGYARLVPRGRFLLESAWACLSSVRRIPRARVRLLPSRLRYAASRPRPHSAVFVSVIFRDLLFSIRAPAKAPRLVFS